jgi:hypothetical protein
MDYISLFVVRRCLIVAEHHLILPVIIAFLAGIFIVLSLYSVVAFISGIFTALNHGFLHFFSMEYQLTFEICSIFMRISQKNLYILRPCFWYIFGCYCSLSEHWAPAAFIQFSAPSSGHNGF